MLTHGSRSPTIRQALKPWSSSRLRLRREQWPGMASEDNECGGSNSLTHSQRRVSHREAGRLNSVARGTRHVAVSSNQWRRRRSCRGLLTNSMWRHFRCFENVPEEH